MLSNMYTIYLETKMRKDADDDNTAMGNETARKGWNISINGKIYNCQLFLGDTCTNNTCNNKNKEKAFESTKNDNENTATNSRSNKYQY